MPRQNHIPSYRLHKQSHQDVATLPNGLVDDAGDYDV